MKLYRHHHHPVTTMRATRAQAPCRCFDRLQGAHFRYHTDKNGCFWPVLVLASQAQLGSIHVDDCSTGGSAENGRNATPGPSGGDHCTGQTYNPTEPGRLDDVGDRGQSGRADSADVDGLIGTGCTIHPPSPGVGSSTSILPVSVLISICVPADDEHASFNASALQEKSRSGNVIAVDGGGGENVMTTTLRAESQERSNDGYPQEASPGGSVSLPSSTSLLHQSDCIHLDEDASSTGMIPPHGERPSDGFNLSEDLVMDDALVASTIEHFFPGGPSVRDNASPQRTAAVSESAVPQVDHLTGDDATEEFPVLAPPAEIRNSATRVHTTMGEAGEAHAGMPQSEDQSANMQEGTVASKTEADEARKIVAQDLEKRKRKGHLAYRYLMGFEMTAEEKEEHFKLKKWQAAEDVKLARQREKVEKQKEVGGRPTLRGGMTFLAE
jgi:hypothetical protein